MSQPTTASRPPPRCWLSLLTGRWHTSSRAVMVLVLLVLVFCNVPGQSVKRMWYELGHHYAVSKFEHGWPLTYLIRTELSFFPPAERTVRDCFELWRDSEEFRIWSLVANCFVVLLVSLATGAAFEAWRRQRNRVWQFHLRDLFAATLAVSLVALWYVHARRQYAVEKAILFPPGEESDKLSVQSHQAGGITWIRICLGDELFRFLDRPFEVTVFEGGGWSQLDKLWSVRHVDAQIRATTEELAHLANMSHLEALSLDDPRDFAPDNVVAELPPLPNLRGLYLSQPAHRCRRLDRLTSLEAFRITDIFRIDDQALREISVLPNLRQLALNGLSESADLSFLPSRPRLSALDLYNSEVSGAALASIGQCAGLTELSLYMCQVDGSGIRHLSRLTNLETLNLTNTDVTAADLKELANLKRLRRLELTDTKVGGDARAYLRQMKQLKWLRVSNFDEDELEELRAALPECQIDRH